MGSKLIELSKKRELERTNKVITLPNNKVKMVYLSYCHTKKMCVVKQLPNDTNPIMMTDSLKSERYKKMK